MKKNIPHDCDVIALHEVRPFMTLRIDGRRALVDRKLWRPLHTVIHIVYDDGTCTDVAFKGSLATRVIVEEVS